MEAGLAEFGAQVRFRHPLVRSAVYRSASVQTRQELHGALAEATDPAVDPDRRAWHRAQAAPGPDEEVAAELEQSAGRAQRRGGLAAAAAFLERSAGLTLDPARRAQRALAAAQAKHQAGALDAALGLLAMAQAGPLDELQRARGDLLRAQIAFASSHGRDAPPLMLSAAKQLFTTMGIEAFAERARRELLATGDTVRKRTVETVSELTAQEAHIARLATGGRTNVEIGAQLFLSTRTVEWHLSKVYTKLGVGSRRELRRALASLGQADPQA